MDLRLLDELEDAYISYIIRLEAYSDQFIPSLWWCLKNTKFFIPVEPR
jgi:hypothetical protein